MIRFEQLFNTNASHGTIIGIIQTTADSANSYAIEGLTQAQKVRQDLESHIAVLDAKSNLALQQAEALNNQVLELEFLMSAKCIS